MSIIGTPQQLFAKASITHSLDLYAKATTQATNSLFAKAGITHSENLHGDATIRYNYEELYAKAETQATRDLTGIATIRHSGTGEIFSKVTIRHSGTTDDLRAEARVTVEGWEMQGLTATVYRDLGVIS